MPLVSKPAAFACAAERLAWAGSGPDSAIVGPPGAAERVGPNSDAGEEMTLSKSGKFVGMNVTDVPLVHDAGRDAPRSDQVAQPLRGVRVVLVVEGAHSAAPTIALLAGVSRQPRPRAFSISMPNGASRLRIWQTHTSKILSLSGPPSGRMP